MKLFDMKIGSGFWVGAGIVLLAPVLIPVTTSVLRSLTKATIKGSLIAYHKAKIAAAETIEGFEDLAAEAKSEISETPKSEPAKKAPESKPSTATSTAAKSSS
jgi:hypothetical protein